MAARSLSSPPPRSRVIEPDEVENWQALVQENQRLKRQLQQACTAENIAVFEADAMGSWLAVTGAWQELTGMSPESALALAWLDAVHKDDRGRVQVEWSAAVQERRELLLNFRLLSPDAESCWVRFHSQPLVADRDASGHAGTITMDVSEKLLRGQSSQLANQRDEMNRIALERSIQLTGVAHFEYSVPLTRNDVWSDHVCTVLGISLHEAKPTISEYVEQCVHPDDRPRFAALQQSIARGAPYDFEYRVIDAETGRTRYLHVMGEPILNNRGQVVRVVNTVLDISERITAREERERHKEQLLVAERAITTKVIQTVNHPLMVLNNQLRVQIANRALYHACGVTPADVLDTHITDVPISADDQDLLCRQLDDVLHGRESSAEVLMTTDKAASQPRTLKARILPLNLDNEAALLLDIWDLTEHAQEQKLHQDVLANVHDAIIETDLQFRIKQWNRGAEVLYGWSSSEVVGRRVHDVVPTAFEDSSLLAVRQQLFAGGHWSGEATQQRRNGEPVHVDASISMLRDHMGTPLGVVSINRDVTERKQSQKLLAQRARQQQAVAELGMYAVNQESAATMKQAVSTVASILSIDRCEVFELLPDGSALLLREGIGCPPELIRNATVAADAISQVSFALQTGRPFIVEDATSDPRLAGSATREDKGAVSGLSVVIPGTEEAFGVLSVNSHTPRAFSPDDVHFLQAVANIIADALTRTEITHQLRHANRLNTVGKLAVSLTHEFGTPLNVISAYSKMMLRGQLQGQEQVDGLRAINEQVGRATHLVRQLLDFSRQRSSGRSTDGVGIMILRTVDMLRPLARQRRVSLDLSILETDRSTTMSEQTLQQVLSNLIINAIDAQTNGGSVDVDISIAPSPTAATSEPEEFICISIADQGSGVPEHLRDQIFNAFFTTKQAGRGTGLGLSVSKQLIEEIGGTIILDSEATTGACFRVYIPVRYQR